MDCYFGFSDLNISPASVLNGRHLPTNIYDQSPQRDIAYYPPEV